MKLITVRHAESVGNASHTMLKDEECGLSERGKRQVKELAMRLAKEKISRIYCSPFKRTRQTCAAVNAFHNAPVEYAEELREINVGRFLGLTFEKREKKYPRVFDAAFTNPSKRLPGGESLNDVRKRLQPFIRKLKKAEGNRTVLVVAHNVANRVLISSLIGLPLDKCRAIKQKNCAVAIMDLGTEPVQLYTLDNSVHKIR